LDALKQIKQAFPKLPVLIMSMYPENLYALRVLKGGAAGYLSKNSIHDDLVKAIETVLMGKKFITPSIAEMLAWSFTENDEPHCLLSDREFEIFKLLGAGKTTSEIANQLLLSTNTVSTYRSRIMGKMKLSSNVDLIRYALEKKLV